MAPLSPEDKIHLYREIVRSRRLQTSALKQFNNGNIGGWLLLSVGQEALAVVAFSLMGEDDHLICGPRSFSYALASGMTMNEIMAELSGKTTGCSRGKGGMFGMFAPHQNFHGAFATAGAQTPVGIGFAFALKYHEKNGVALCVLGDGATNQGAFHESLNLASLFHLPVVFIIENNQFSMGTSVARHSAGSSKPLARLAEGYDIAWDVIEDGSNLLSLRKQFEKAMNRARDESRPTIVEVKTYRFYGFSVADAMARKYRKPKEIEFHKEHYDPVKNWGLILAAEGVLSLEEQKTIRMEAMREAEMAADFAAAAPVPTTSELTENVYWELDQPQRYSEGTLIFE